MGPNTDNWGTPYCNNDDFEISSFRRAFYEHSSRYYLKLEILYTVYFNGPIRNVIKLMIFLRNTLALHQEIHKNTLFISV